MHSHFSLWPHRNRGGTPCGLHTCSCYWRHTGRATAIKLWTLCGMLSQDTAPDILHSLACACKPQATLYDLVFHRILERLWKGSILGEPRKRISMNLSGVTSEHVVIQAAPPVVLASTPIRTVALGLTRNHLGKCLNRLLLNSL